MAKPGLPCSHVIPNGAQRREESRVLRLLG